MGVITRSLRRYHSSRFLTEANIFCIITFFLALAVPFYLSFSTENFWLKAVTEPLSITHTFTGNYIATVHYKNSTVISTQTFSNVAELTSFGTPTISRSVTGVSKGNKHYFTVSWTNLPSTTTILDIELIVFFDTAISELNRLDYTSAIVRLGQLSQKSIYNAFGCISFSTRAPISFISSSNIKQNLPPYFQGFSYATDLQTIKRNMFKGNYLLTSQILSTSGNQVATPTTLTINLELVSSKYSDVSYYPGFLRTLKIAFSQYISLFIIAFVMVTALLRTLAKSDTFPLQETSDVREIQYSIRHRP